MLHNSVNGSVNNEQLKLKEQLLTIVWHHHWKHYYNYHMYVTRFGKTDCIVTTSETAFIAPYHRYIHILFKTQWRSNKRWPGLLFHMAFSWPCKTVKSQYRQWGISRGLQWDDMNPDCLLHISFVFCCGLWLVLVL